MVRSDPCRFSPACAMWSSRRWKTNGTSRATSRARKTGTMDLRRSALGGADSSALFVRREPELKNAAAEPDRSAVMAFCSVPGPCARPRSRGDKAAFRARVRLTHLHSLLVHFGPWAVFLLVAMESAGIPLPGETILVTAAVLAGRTHEGSIVEIIASAAAGAICRRQYRLLGRARIRPRPADQAWRAHRPRRGQAQARAIFVPALLAAPSSSSAALSRCLRAFAAVLAGANNFAPWRFFLLQRGGRHRLGDDFRPWRLFSRRRFPQDRRSAGNGGARRGARPDFRLLLLLSQERGEV